MIPTDMGKEKDAKNDLVSKYAPHACCITVLLCAGIMWAFVYFIYWVIQKLI